MRLAGFDEIALRPGANDKSRVSVLLANAEQQDTLTITHKFQSVGTSMGVSRGDKRSIKGHRGIRQMETINREKTPCAPN
jgi:hypothetical protein